MSDDIVTRLHRIASLQGDLVGRIIPVTCMDAADEIRRLRKAGDQLAYWALQENLAGELISAAKAWKAVRGE